jgi:Retrotransposon gag protein
MSWERFSDIFRARFMGEHQLSVLRYRFETLTQGSRTARQYGELFIRLSRYAPELVADPSRHRARFIRGLQPALASVLDIYPGTSVEFLMDKAEYQESLIGARAAARNIRPRFEGASTSLPPPRPPTPVPPHRPPLHPQRYQSYPQRSPQYPPRP